VRALQFQQLSILYPQSRLSLGTRCPTLDCEAGTKLTPLGCFGKSVKGGTTLSELPPPVREEEFQAVDTTNEGAIREYFHDFIDELHTFLNHNSCLRDVQRVRRRNWRPRSKASYPFGEDSFVVQSRHWYTRNVGGRNEAQFNVGMFPRYMRVGLGFEFTERAHGKPTEVQPVWGQFREILRARRQEFEQKAREHSLMVEWVPRNASEVKHVEPQGALGWLLKPTRVPEWVFVGRLLDRRNDAEILSDPTRLGAVMETVFGELRPLWRDAQLRATQYQE
jgi:hypothetical protein